MLKVEVVGHLGGDAEMKSINGKDYISMSVAVKEIGRDSSGAKEEKTIWISVLKPEAGSNLLPYLKKGTKLFLRGSLQVRTFEDKEGQIQVSINLYATELVLC